MTERTPGTWVAKPHPFGSCWWVDTVDGSIQVAMATLHKGEKDEANANLIAAAPDLLEAAERAVCDGFCYHIRCERLRAAIAKAKGETP